MRAAARRAALVGGDVIRAGRRPSEGEAKRLPGDWVTEVDLASEAAIRAFLDEGNTGRRHARRGVGGRTEGLRWVVDPLDGTTNFLHGFPAVGVSVALVADEAPVAGAIQAPFLGDTWHAARGAGPSGNRRRGTGTVPRVGASAGTRSRRDGIPLPPQGRLPRYLAAFAAARRPIRGSPPPRCGVPGSRLGGVRRLRRLLRAGARAVGRRGRRPPGGGSGRTRHRLGGRCRLSVGRHPGWLASGSPRAARDREGTWAGVTATGSGGGLRDSWTSTGRRSHV